MKSQKQSGNNGEKVTPVPISNTEVKLLSADGSWDFVPVRVGRCQAQKAQPDKGCVFLCVQKDNNVDTMISRIRSLTALFL